MNRKRLFGGLLILTILVSLLFFFLPAYWIRPFVAQTPRTLDLAYTLRQNGPWVTLVCLAIGSLTVVGLWNQLWNRLGKVALATSLLWLMGSTVLTRWNYFEWKFQPLPRPGFVEVSKASHVGDSDMVLGIEIAGEARAYPVRIMAYHHVVNDVVGGMPLAATY
jgi:hypothetical protein